MALLENFVDETSSDNPVFDLNDGYSLPDTEDAFESTPPPGLGATRNSMQLAMQIADSQTKIHKSLQDPDNVAEGYGGDPFKMRKISGTQRFFASTGLIDGRAPMAQPHAGLNYSSVGAQGHGDAPAFTPQAQWNAMFPTQPTDFRAKDRNGAALPHSWEPGATRTTQTDNPYQFSSPI